MTAQKKLAGYRLQVTNIKRLFVILGLSILLATIPSTLTTVAHAQNFDIASTYQIADTDAKSGDIITSSQQNQKLVRASSPYDNNLFGILVDSPVLVYKESSGSGRAVARTGDAVVNISDYNGSVKIGDYITSSPIGGIGMKATQSGYVVGIVTSTPAGAGSLNFQNKSYQLTSAHVALNIQFAELSGPRNTNSLLSAVGSSLFQSAKDPGKFTQVMKYIIAGIVAILSFVIGFFAFTRGMAKGVEAIGRNPLAKGTIQVSIIIQLILTVFTTLAGLAASLLILRL